MIGRFAVAASLAADAIAFYALAEWLAAAYVEGEKHAPPAWAFLLVAAAAFGLPRLAAWYGFEGRRAYTTTAVVALVLMYALVRHEVTGDWRIWQLGWVADFLSDADQTPSEAGRGLFAAVLLSATWMRVSLRSADEVEMETIPRSVGWGFILVTALLLAATASTRSGEVARAGAAYYALAIIALACSQLALSGVTIGEGKAGGVVGMLLGGTLVATAAGLAVFGLLFGLLAPILGPIIGAVVQGVLTVVLTPVAWLLTRFFEALFHGANPFENLPDQTVNRARDAGEGDQSGHAAWRDWFAYAMRTLALVVILGLAALALGLFMRIRRRSSAAAEEDASMSIAGSAGDDLREFLRSLFPKRKARPPSFASTEATRLYLEVLERAERDGISREQGETAAEFQPALASRYRADVSADITRAFEQARYGGREPDARMLEELRRRWRTVR